MKSFDEKSALEILKEKGIHTGRRFTVYFLIRQSELRYLIVNGFKRYFPGKKLLIRFTGWLQRYEYRTTPVRPFIFRMRK